MIDRRKALENGFTLDAIAALPEMGCPDCISIETPYFYSDEAVGVLQEHQDLCPRWKVASEDDRIDPEATYPLGDDGGVWTGADLIKARMADPKLFTRKQGAAL